MYRQLFESQERKRRGHGKGRTTTDFPKTSKLLGGGRHEKTRAIFNNMVEKDRTNWVEVDYTMDDSVKQLFLNLTKMQIPFNFEKTLVQFFPEDMEADGNGNYWKKIGDNKIMFCGHLDTYCHDYKRVWHEIDENIIKTDGTTTLGGDDKAGITVMIKMMEAGVPGTYYFFRGEEGVTSPTGTWGSKQALKSRKEFFTQFDKCIAFDRKGFASIISEQMYTECCSSEFVKALEAEFKKNGLEYKDDPTGMWCDSGVFMETIPECTNISVGYKSEHTFNETQDIEHLEKLVKAAIAIDWESLPVKRDPTQVSRGIGRYSYDYDYAWDSDYGRGGKVVYTSKRTPSGKPFVSSSREEKRRDYVSMEDVFHHICDILDELDYECVNPNDFKEAAEMYFQNIENSDFFGVRIIDYDIYTSEDETLKKYVNIGKLEDFRKYVMTGINPNDIEDLDREMDRKIGKPEKEIRNELDGRLSKLELDAKAELAAKKDMKEDDEPSKGDYNYTKRQMDVFSDVAQKNPELVKTIMDNMTDANTPLHSNLWLQVEKAITALGYKLDYDAKGGINSDDFSEWVYDNWNDMKVLVDTKTKPLSDKMKKVIANYDKPSEIVQGKKKFESGFLSTIKDNVYMSKLHNDQLMIFAKLIQNERLITKMMLKDFEINNKAEVRDTLMKQIWFEMGKIDYKRSDKTPFTAYPQMFVDFVYEYSDDIKKYYDMK